MTCPLCVAGYHRLPGGHHVNVTLGQVREDLGPCTATEDEQRRDPAGLLARFHEDVQACKERVTAARLPPPVPHQEKAEREIGEEG